MNTQESAPAHRAEQARVERAIRFGLVLVTFVFAFVVQSQFFAYTNSFRGDVAYHRGVAETMLNGHLQGEGPLPGLLSYYGGLYPLTFAAGIRILGVSFDGLLSVVSWFATFALPAAFLLLGRRLWPKRPIDQGILVFVGTVGSSLALDARVEWVNSFLPSGTNLWPLYPRDVAAVLLVLALGVAMGGDSLRRYAAVGLLGAVAVASQPQDGLLAVVAVAVWAFVQAGWAHRRDALPRALVAVGVAAAASAWYWVPRVVAVINDHLASGGYPAHAGLSIAAILGGLGVTGVLALVGTVVMLRASSRSPAERFFLWWAIVGTSLLFVAPLLGDVGGIITSARRAWFLMGVPVVVLAARGGAKLLRAVPLLLGVPILVLALAVPATIEALDTRRTVDDQWGDDARGWEPFSDQLWSSALATLTHTARDDSTLRVLVPDNDAEYVWSRTGAQPFSLWLESGTALGFDPAKAGISYLARVHGEQQAFSGGLTALCALARSDHAGVLVLRGANGLIAVRDIRPSARWRVAPQDRSLRTSRRRVAPGVRYRDLNATEDLLVLPGASIPVGFSGADIRAVEVQLRRVSPRSSPRVELQLPGGATMLPARTQRDGVTITTRFSTAHGLPPGARIVARSMSVITRAMGYQVLRAAHTVAPNGTTARPVVMATADVCGGRSTGKR